MAGLERLITRTIDAGCNGVFVLGSTGEGQALSYRLRSEMVRATCAMVGDRLPVLVGISDTAVDESVSLARKSMDAGASGLVLAPPYYFRMAQSDILRYIETVAAEVQAPLFLYNIPSMTKIALEVDTIARAAQIENVVGCKDSSGDLIFFQRVLRAVRHVPDFSVFIGPEELLADAILLGGHGGVTGGANLRPDLYVALYRAATERRMEEVRVLQGKVMDLSENVYRVGDPSTSYFRGIKCALELAGICSGEPAPPLSRLTVEEASRIRKWLGSS